MTFLLIANVGERNMLQLRGESQILVGRGNGIVLEFAIWGED